MQFSPPGEPTQKNRSIKSFAAEALHDLIHFDTKLLKTVKPLITKPGFLTNQAFTPAQTAYVKPLALFVFVNFIFFIFKSRGLFNYTLDTYYADNFFKHSIAENIAASHLPVTLFTERFNTSMKFEQQEYVIVMVPLFALFIHLLYFKTRRYYTEHLIFSLHFYSFVIIFLMVLPYIARLINYITSLFGHIISIWDTNASLGIMIFTVISVYLFIALKNVYRQPILLTALKTLLSAACFIFLIVFVYRTLLFYIVMHSVHE